MKSRIAILASGSGSIAQALLDASAREDLGGGAVVLVLSDRADAFALTRAKDAGVEALFLDPSLYPDRAAYCEAIAGELKRREVDLVCLAGFMKILTPDFIRGFRGRVLNTHPALLPSFPGARGVRDALTWGVKVTGATIHLADEEVDQGPILLQEAVYVLPGEDENALHERIKQVERRLYPEAVRALVSGKVKVEGRQASIEGTE